MVSQRTIYSSGVEAGMTIHRLNMLLQKKNRKIERLKRLTDLQRQVIQKREEEMDNFYNQAVSDLSRVTGLVLDGTEKTVNIPYASPCDC